MTDRFFVNKYFNEIELFKYAYLLSKSRRYDSLFQISLSVQVACIQIADAQRV